MTSVEFELLAKKFLEKKLKKWECTVEHGKTLTSKTGVDHQVDLHYRINIAGMEYLTIVECKFWNRNIPKERIATLYGVKEDLKAQKGIVIANVGFQQGAIEFAKATGIGLIRLTESESEDIAHFDGGMNELFEVLAEEPKAIYGKPDFRGIFFPEEMSLWSYLDNKYGKGLSLFLLKAITSEEFSFLDQPRSNLPIHIQKAIARVEDDWSKEYHLFESAGLNFKLENENMIRMVNQILLLMKTDIIQ